MFNLKFFHLSDLHIGLKLMNRDLKEDHIYILNEIVDLAVQYQPDAVVIAGDIYDKAVPSAESVEVFDAFISNLIEKLPGIYILLISGNHDSAPRVNCFRNILINQHVYMIGMPPQKSDEHIEKVVLKDDFGPVNFYLLPFIKPSMVRKIVNENQPENTVIPSLSYDETMRKMLAREDIDTNERNVFVSHQFYLPKGMKAEDIERTDSEIRTVGNVDEIGSDVLEIFDYAALGHIHKPMKAGSDMYRYCGTPLACSVSEAEQKKHVLMVDMKEKGNIAVAELPLVPLRKVRVIKGVLEDVLQQACEDYVTVILTDQVDVDVMDMQDRLRYAFPYLLEIRRENVRKADVYSAIEMEQLKNPLELCCAFLKDLDDDEMDILQDVINQVREENV